MNETLIQIAQAITGIYRSDLTKAEVKIFNILTKQGYLTTAKDGDEQVVVLTKKAFVELIKKD